MSNYISIPSAMAEKLRQHFFQSELEQGAFIFAEARREPGELNLLATDYYLVPASGWEVQMEVYLQMKDSERARIMKLAREKNLCAIDCHSHPHAHDDVWFSPSDVAGITDFAKYAKWKLGGKPFAAMVWGEQSVDAVIWQGEFLHAERVAHVNIIGNGNQTLTPAHSWFREPKGTTDLHFMNNNRFNRQVLMFGEAGQEQIEKQIVGVAGAGGLGSPICQALAYLGVRNFGVIDDDRLDETNMNREAGAFPPDVGRLKVEVVKEHILKINPEATVRPIPRNLRSREALEFLTRCTHIFGAVDHDGPRLVFTELAAAYGIPLIDVATEIFPAKDGQPFDFGGRVVVAKPGDYCLCCADQLNLELAKEELETVEVRTARRKHGYGLGRDERAPSVFALNGILANAAVMEFLVMVTGIREPARHLTYKGMRGVITSRSDGRKPGCFFCEYVCGQREKINIWRYILSEE